MLRSDQCVARSEREAESIFQVFAARGAAWVARKEPEHKNAEKKEDDRVNGDLEGCLLYTSPSPRDLSTSRMPSSA